MMMIDSRGRSVFEVGEAGMGKPAMEEMEGLADTEAVQASFKGKVSASYMGGSNIIYTAPVRVRGEVIGVLAGGRSKENMQKMIASKSFCGNALGCITDSSGDPTGILQRKSFRIRQLEVISYPTDMSI